MCVPQDESILLEVMFEWRCWRDRGGGVDYSDRLARWVRAVHFLLELHYLYRSLSRFAAYNCGWKTGMFEKKEKVCFKVICPPSDQLVLRLVALRHQQTRSRNDRSTDSFSTGNWSYTQWITVVTSMLLTSADLSQSFIWHPPTQPTQCLEQLLWLFCKNVKDVALELTDCPLCLKTQKRALVSNVKVALWRPEIRTDSLQYPILNVASIRLFNQCKTFVNEEKCGSAVKQFDI